MNTQPRSGLRITQPRSRREFLMASTGLAGVGALAASTPAPTSGVAPLPRPGPVAEKSTIKIALVGCGGRGTGAAANALSTVGPTQLWAMADVFPHRLESSLKALSAAHTSQVYVPPERQFLGFDGYRKAIDSLGRGDVVLLTTPPAFRPQHVEYAINKGVHVFMEKSFAVDVPGLRRIQKAGALASQRGLKIAGGLMSRHYLPLEQIIERIHNGAIGEVMTSWAYRMHGPVGFSPRRAEESELAHQIANYSCYTWLNGSFIVDWLIHNIDVCCWVKGAWPVSVQGMGGRQMRDVADQMFDHHAAEFSFADGTRMCVQGRHIGGCHDFFGDVVHGTKGSALLGEGQPKPRLYKGWRQAPEDQIWSYAGAPCDAYQREHDLFFEAIRTDRPYNETDRCVKTCLTAIMGRMACESGRMITLEEAWNSQASLAPGLEDMTNLDAPAPVRPDATGRYPVAMPGKSQPA